MVVFTKYDVLFNEHYRDCLRDKLPPSKIRVETANRASSNFPKCSNSHLSLFKYQRRKIGGNF